MHHFAGHNAPRARSACTISPGVFSVSQQSINKYENHSVEPDINTLIRIADFFMTSVDFIIGHTEERFPIVPASSLGIDNEEFSLLKEYRKLSSKQKACVRMVVESYSVKE